MRRIFLDANIYLEFYQGLKEFEKLLPSLNAVKDDIFVTRQVRDEIDRNKLGVTIKALEALREGVDPKRAGLPALLAIEYKEKFGENWPFSDKSEIESATRKLSDLVKERIEKVAFSTDEISAALRNILDGAKECSAEELEKARFRKERGNPPGKRGDPLGDQLSWEQFKSFLSNGDQVWIITKDKDYSWNFNGTVFLNPVLQKELQAAGTAASDIYVFNSLAQALTEISKRAPLATLPTLAVLEEAEKEERSAIQYSDPVTQGDCQNCGAPGTTIGHWGRSQYGGLTWQYLCRRCGFRFDTGDPYDD
jgi:hypothetical protein